MGQCYKFTVNTHSPVPRTDEEERSGLMPVLQSEAQAEPRVGSVLPGSEGWRAAGVLPREAARVSAQGHS